MKHAGIGFDYGGVVAGPIGDTFVASITKLLSIDLEEYKTAYWRHNTAMNDGKIGWEDFWEQVLRELGKTEKSSELRTFLTEWPTHRLNDDVVALAGKLKSAGYKVGILSNNSLENLARMKQAGLEQYFNPIIVSADIARSKPSPEAFRIFFARLGTKPEETVFIDDGERNILAAQELGCAGILYKDYKSLVRSLAELGIEVP